MNDSSTIDPRTSELSATVSGSWKRFLEIYEPLRPELYRFCRYLSRSPWDADGGLGDGMDPRFAQGVLPRPARLELRFHRGEPLLLSWYAHHDGEFVRAISLVEPSAEGDRIARLRNDFYTPEVLLELCGELGLPCRTNGTFRARGDR
jgi:hypothetical protein